MTDSEDKKTVAEVAETLKTVVDPITKFGEGIAQTIFSIFQDLNFWQKLVMLAVSGYSLKQTLHELRKLAKDDPALEIKGVDYLKREQFLNWLEKLGEEGWQKLRIVLSATREEIKAALTYLAKQDERWAKAIRQNTRQVRREIELLRKKRQAMRLFSPLSWFNRKIVWFPGGWKLFTVTKIVED